MKREVRKVLDRHIHKVLCREVIDLLTAELVEAMENVKESRPTQPDVIAPPPRPKSNYFTSTPGGVRSEETGDE